MITTDLIRAIMPESGPRAALFTLHLVTAAAEFDISTAERVAAWLAQLAHESGQLRYVRELASGEAYEGRKDLGNTQPGDGARFRGRGLIQITGRANYEQLRVALGLDCVAHPAILEEPQHAARVSGWFWKSRGLNELADLGPQEFARITRRINGGINGLPDRQMFYRRARAALGLA